MSADTKEQAEPTRLITCRNCSAFVKIEEVDCPFCGEDIFLAEMNYRIALAEARQAARELTRLMTEAGLDTSKIPEI